MMCHAGFGGVDAETGEYTCFLETLRRRLRRRAASDGPDPCRPDARHRERARRGDRSTDPCGSAGSLIEDSEGPGRFRGGLGLRKDFISTGPPPSRARGPHEGGPWGVVAAGRRVASFVLVRDEAEHVLDPESTSTYCRGTSSATALRRRRLRAPSEREPGACCATCGRGRSARLVPVTCTAWRCADATWTRHGRRSCGS